LPVIVIRTSKVLSPHVSELPGVEVKLAFFIGFLFQKRKGKVLRKSLLILALKLIL
jgi:hypothetical protein